MSFSGGKKYIPPPTKPSSSNVQQGGRSASASDNIKNKANTARLQGEETFRVLDAQGNTVEYNSAQYQQYQEQQKQQQAQQQRQKEIQKQQEIQRDVRREQAQQRQSGLYPGLSDYEGIPKNVPPAVIKRQSGLYPGLSDYEGIPKNVRPTMTTIDQQGKPPITPVSLNYGVPMFEKKPRLEQSFSLAPGIRMSSSYKPPGIRMSSSYKPPPQKKLTRGEARAKGVSRMSDVDILTSGLGKVNTRSNAFREQQQIRKSISTIVDQTPKQTLQPGITIPRESFNIPATSAAFVSGSAAIAKSPIVQYFTPSQREQQPFRESKKGFRPSPKTTTNDQTKFIQENKQRLEGAFEEAKNLGIEILSGELKYGAGFVRTSSGRIAPATKEAKQLAKTFESNYTTDTFTQKLYEGKLGEINLADPRTQGQAALFFGSIVVPAGAPYAKQKAGQLILKEAERFAVKRTENFLKEFGDFFGLEKLQPTELIKVQPTLRQKTRSFITRKPLETDLGFKEVPVKGSQSVYISSGGTAEKPSPFYVLRGSAKKGFKEPTLEEITPTQKSELQTLFPQKINIRGGLSSFEQQQLGVEATKRTLGQRRFIFTSKETPTVEQQRFYKEGVLEKGIIEIGKGKEAPLESVLKGQVEQYTKRGSQYKPSVYSETKAEKLFEGDMGFRSVSSSKPSKGKPSSFTSTKINLGGDSGHIIPKKTQSRIESGLIFRQTSKGLEKYLKEQKESKRFLDDMLDREAKKKDRLIKSGRYTEETYPETKDVDPAPGSKGPEYVSSSGKKQSYFTSTEKDFIKEAVTPKPTSKPAQGPQFLPKYLPGFAFSQNLQSNFQGSKSKSKQPEMFGMSDFLETSVLSKSGSKTMFEDFGKINPKSKSKQPEILGFGDFIKTGVIPKQSQSEFSIISEKLSFKVTPAQTPRQIPKQTPGEGFSFDDMITTKVTPKQTPKLIPGLDQPIIPKQTFAFEQPPRTTPTTFPRGFAFAPFFPGLYLGAGGFESPGSLKKGFAAYGISSDINIKTLPTYSRYSAGTNIFKAQRTEDEMIQNLFYGKPKRKSSKKKSTKKKSKR